MNRRRLLLGAGSFAAGSSALVGTGAFTALTSDRVAAVDVVGDAVSMIGLEPHPGPNGAYAAVRGELLELDVSATNSRLNSGGASAESTIRIDEVFTVTNLGTQSVRVWITDASDAVAFTSTTDAHGSIEDDANAITVAVGESIDVGFTIDTHGDPPGDRLLSGITIHATVSGTTGPGGPGVPTFPTTQQAKLTDSDSASFDQFGRSVAIDADTALVGAPFEDDEGVDAGAAYVFTRSGSSWNQQAKLTAGDAAARDQFGESVAVDGDTALVGAPLEDGEDLNAGAAYVFIRSGSSWIQQAKLTDRDGFAGDLFGRSVAIDGDTALVGAPNDDDNGTNAGAAYVFVP